MVLNSNVIEVLNRNRLVTELLRRGCNCYLPVYDDGIDLVVLRGVDAFRIQLKGRWNIDKKYKARNLLIAFPEAGSWYLAPHDEMEAIGEELGYTRSASWGGDLSVGAYSVPRMSARLASAMARYSLDLVIGLPNEG